MHDDDAELHREATDLWFGAERPDPPEGPSYATCPACGWDIPGNLDGHDCPEAPGRQEEGT